MSIWLVISTIFLIQFQFTSINSFTTVYRHSDSGRKLFGGYRILPRPCTVTSEADGSKPKTGVCMFNYECNQKRGQMIGSCIDGFLFGVCCLLPQSSTNVELENDDALGLGPQVNILSPSSSSSSSSSQSNKRPIFSYDKIKSTTQTGDKWTGPSTIRYTSRPGSVSTYGEAVTTSEDPNKLFNLLITGSGSTHTKTPSNHKPILDQYFSNQTNGQFINNEGFLPLHRYPAPDTILLNPDGTVVEDDKNPEKVFTPKQPTHKIPSKPTTPSSIELSQNEPNYGYVIGNNGLFVVPQHSTTKVEFVTNDIIDATVSSVQKIITKTTGGQISGKPSQLQGSYLYSTQRPIQSNTPGQSHLTFVKHPNPGTMTTAALLSKKTDLLPLSPTTPKPNPPYVIADDNMVLLPTFTSQNKIKKPTTRVPTDSGQSTSKSSYKPIRVTSKIPIKTTTSSNYDLDDKYSSYNYNFYTGSSKPPILITHPVGLDDNGQAISHILEILNSTHPKVESVTQSMNADLGLSTWVSIIGDEKPTKNKYPKPGSAKPTSTTFVHGPSYSVTSGGNKPAPTVVVISHDTSANDYHSKPTRRPVSTYTTLTTNKLVIRRPVGVLDEEEIPKPNKPTQYDENNVYHTGQENLISFPPVRNPDLNTTALNQMEKPTVVQTYVTGQNELVHLPNGITLEVAPENVDLNTIDADEEYDEITTPAFQEDKVESQVHTFVEKIVNSLSGNFQDLEQILFNNENKTSIINNNGIQLNNIHMGDEQITTEDSGTILTTTRKPIRRPTTIRPSDLADTVAPETSTSFPTKKPKPTTKKPSTNVQGTIIKRPTTVRPLADTEPNQKPTVTSAVTTKKPVTAVPTRRPTVASTAPTKRPTTVTKRPTVGTTLTKPTKRPTTTVTTTTTTRRPTVTKRPKPVTTTKRTIITTSSTTTTTEEVTDLPPDLVTPEAFEPSTEEVTLDYRRECGVRPLVKKGGRIVGGKGSQFGYYPWQVLVRESTWLGLFTKNKCGGVLITNRYVITAAHCQPGFLASLVAVFGEYDISGELEAKRSVSKNVRRVIVHRQYDPATFENDLALLELDSPITYEEHIVPICMPRDGEDYVGRMATVTGWGRLKYGGGVPSVLQEVRVPLIENSVCQEMFQTAGHQKRIISSFLCAGYANGQKDSCEGDSGGPLMVEREDGRWVLLGTVSHGIKCAAPYLPGVYMRTTYYKPWLKSITGVST